MTGPPSVSRIYAFRIKLMLRKTETDAAGKPLNFRHSILVKKCV